jgi:hypothetical protein
MHRLVIVCFSLLAATASLCAQAPTVAAAQTTVRDCTYATCALRVENGGFSGPRIRTGLDGAARKVGFTGNGIVDAVRAAPAALTEAQLGHARMQRGRVIGLIATSAAFVWIIAASQSNRDATRLASIYGGTSVSVLGGVFSAMQLAKADQHFSRAVWMYNNSLAR